MRNVFIASFYINVLYEVTSEYRILTQTFKVLIFEILKIHSINRFLNIHKTISQKP